MPEPAKVLCAVVLGGALAVPAALDLLEVLFVDITRDGGAGRPRQNDTANCPTR